MCAKTRFWKAFVPADAFRFLRGEDALTEYRFGSGALRHLFCRHCGVKPCGRGELPGGGPFVAVNVACLDASDEELASAPVEYQNGRHDRWETPPGETRHL